MLSAPVGHTPGEPGTITDFADPRLPSTIWMAPQPGRHTQPAPAAQPSSMRTMLRTVMLHPLFAVAPDDDVSEGDISTGKDPTVMVGTALEGEGDSPVGDRPRVPGQASTQSPQRVHSAWLISGTHRWPRSSRTPCIRHYHGLVNSSNAAIAGVL